MTRPAAAVGAALALAGCGSSTETTAGRPATRTAKTATAARPAAKATPAPARPSPRRRARAHRYEQAVGTLPYRAGPLPVAQTITSEDRPEELVARLSPRTFFCLGPPTRRRAAVASYYRLARSRVRARGLDDVQLVVAPLGPTAAVSVVWARASRGRVTLTASGRSGRC